MADKKPRSRFRRWLLRLALAGLAGALLLLAWFLFLPVPLGWAVNYAARRAAPAGGALTVKVHAATFRWHFGATELDFAIDALAADAAGQPLARVERIRLVFNKSALFSRHWLPSRVEVTSPLLSLDFKGAGWPHHPFPSAPASSTQAKFDPAALTPFLPADGVPFALDVQGFAVELIAPERTVTWRFQPIVTTLARAADNLSLALSLGLAETKPGAKPVTLTARVEGKTTAHTLHFSANVPAFRTEDLPALPLDPVSLPLAKSGLAFDLDGTVDLEHVTLPELRFRFVADNGELTLPAVKSGVRIVLTRFEAAGHATDNAATIAFDTLALELDSVRLTATNTVLTTGNPKTNTPASLRTHLALTGPDGNDLVAWLPAALAKSLPFPADGLREIGLASFDADLDAKLDYRELVGATARTLALSGSLALALGAQKLSLNFRATLPAPDQPLAIHVDLPELRPAAFAGLAVLKQYPFVSALDLPVRLAADLTATAKGEWRTASATLAATAPGTLHAYGPLPHDLPVRAFTLAADTPDAARTVHVTALTFDFDGPKLSLETITAKLPPASAPAGPIEAEGKFTAENFSGAFLAAYLPPMPPATPGGPSGDVVRDRLAPLGIAPADFTLDRFTGSFTARATPGAAAPESAKFTGNVLAHFQDQPLALDLTAVLAEKIVTATLALASPVNPARFRLKLPGDPPLAALDVPVQFTATVSADLDGKKQDATVRLTAGPGVIHATKQYFNAELPVTSLALTAAVAIADGVPQTLALDTLALDLDGIRVNAGQIKLPLAAPGRASGSLSVENITVAHALQLWPEDLLPDIRKQIAPMLKDGGGELTRAAFTFAAPFDLKNPAATRPAELKGDVKIVNVRATPPQAPGPVTLQELAVNVAWPTATVTATNLAAPGVTVPVSTIRVSDLDKPAQLVEASVNYGADFSQTSAWLALLKTIKLPADLPLDLTRLVGRADGRLVVRSKLDLILLAAPESIELTANIIGLVVPLTLPGYELGQGEFALTATAVDGKYSAKLDWKNLRLAVPGALTGPVSLMFSAGGSESADEFTVGMVVNAAEARLLLAGDTALPPLAPVTAEAKVTGWLRQPKPQVALSASSANVLGAPLALAATASFNKAESRVERATVSDFKLGRTSLHVEATNPAPGRYEVSVTGERVDTPGLLLLAAPFLPRLLPAAPAKTSAPVSAKPISTTPTSPAAAPLSLKADVKFTEIELGNNLAAHDLALAAELRDGKPVSASLTSREGAANTFALTLAPVGDHHTVALAVSDIPSWVRALTSPLVAAKLPPGQIASLVAEVAKVPAILKGGRLDFSGDLRLAEPGKLFDGKFSLRDTTMIRPPVVLQLIALKTRSAMQTNPLLKEMSAKRIYFNDTAVGMEGIGFTVSGLVNWLSLNTARYGLKDESIYTDGKYGIFEFEVKGFRPTLGLKDVYLKDNAVIRAIGTQSDLDFGDPDPPAPKKP